MTMIIAGIGSRKTPMGVLQVIEQAGMMVAMKGHIGRSGGADGADTAFERGIRVINKIGCYVYKPDFVYDVWRDHAAKFHPAWGNCSDYAKDCHARNSAIICGDNLMRPVNAVLCWTPDGAIVGGTGQALRVAMMHGIPIFNLAVTPIDQFNTWIAAQ